MKFACKYERKTRENGKTKFSFLAFVTIVAHSFVHSFFFLVEPLSLHPVLLLVEQIFHTAGCFICIVVIPTTTRWATVQVCWSRAGDDISATIECQPPEASNTTDWQLVSPELVIPFYVLGVSAACCFITKTFLSPLLLFFFHLRRSQQLFVREIFTILIQMSRPSSRSLTISRRQLLSDG